MVSKLEILRIVPLIPESPKEEGEEEAEEDLAQTLVAKNTNELSSLSYVLTPPK